MTAFELDHSVDEEIQKLREELDTKIFDQGFHWRIMFLGRSINGTTDIVSSMSRSLRNLGHHVLDLDTAKHKLTNNPTRATGGNGPIFVEYDKIESFVENFRPQMIICCAGGLTFTESDAAALKARGIVLVGITLSDPDVFPSIVGHAHVFDYHTTNAELSLAMYKAQGVNNTVYFPFGIDRGFVTQEVTAAPEFAADVICLGHANNRPDRNNTMTHLAKTLDVKTYGRGWELEGSEVVAGDRALQALKMGRVHINFPLTRAGYINIKCGVFESIGAGAVVATQNFEEMERFFSYGDELLGYDNEFDLEEQIEQLLADPIRYGEMRVAGFKRLINSHLYEHRWMDLFETIRNSSASENPWLGDDRSAEIREILTASLPRSRKVILSGFYGANNLGDEMILKSISDRLAEADPSIQVFVGAENALQVEKSHGLQAFKRTDHHAASQVVRTASAVVVGGGGLWHDHTIQRAGGIASFFLGAPMSIAGFGILPSMGKLLGIPFYTVGLGVGPLTDADARLLVKDLALKASAINVRDMESKELLSDVGVPDGLVTVSPDTVYAVDLSSAAATASPPAELLELKEQGYTLVGLNLRHWKAADGAAWHAQLLSAVEKLSATRKIAVVGLPMQLGASHDEHCLAEFCAALPQHIPSLVLGGDFGLREYIGALSAVDSLIAMRLHAALIAHRLGTPVMGLSYDPKVRRHYEEVGAADLCVDIENSAADYDNTLQAVIDLGGNVRTETAGLVQELERQAIAALRDTASRIAAEPENQDVYRIPSERPAFTKASEKPAKALQVKAAFTAVETRATKLRVIPERRLNVRFDSPRAVQISLPTSTPWAGQGMEQKGSIRVHGTGPVEIAVSIANRYRNPRNNGKIQYVVRIGDYVLIEDLTASNDVIQLRYTTAGEGEIPFSLRVVVLENCQQAEGWKRYTNVTARILHAAPVPASSIPGMFASARTVLPLTEAVLMRGCEHLIVETAQEVVGESATL
ncbi:polysaccharide pyruvyl transferase family protein [Pseudarthrobacter sp. J75]|uniref:polysaccharide pyruvyl transferase family protein n=1 Tax=Pseudarthrobacter sp. J75 TaxID=3116486 RepID=UPI002E80A273|nr:polysaccharide pyruvyl transferase family protein [Pseudarthrobacter sp. J75]MEE2528800.1 polysaccharide pyruvyl transferase family protein [Pseudarthrobacter sp. J75]